MLQPTALVISSRDLAVGDRVIEQRFAGGTRREVSYEVVEVNSGRFMHYAIADEQGVSWRTYEGEVRIEGPAFAGERYAA